MDENEDFFQYELLALELRERLLAFDCALPYEMALRQVREFVAREAADAEVTEAGYLAARAPGELVSVWVEQIVAVSQQLEGEIEGDYPLLAITHRDAGVLVELISTTITATRHMDESGLVTDSGLRVLTSLGRQIALPSMPDGLCLLTQNDVFALNSFIGELRAAPVDLRDAPEMDWVESCHAMIEGCFAEIADRLGAGEDLTAAERRVFVVSLTEDEGTSGRFPPSNN